MSATAADLRSVTANPCRIYPKASRDLMLRYSLAGVSGCGSCPARGWPGFQARLGSRRLRDRAAGHADALHAHAPRLPCSSTPRSPARRQWSSASSPVRKRATRSPAAQYRLSHTVDKRSLRSTRHPDCQLAATSGHSRDAVECPAQRAIRSGLSSRSSHHANAFPLERPSHAK